MQPQQQGPRMCLAFAATSQNPDERSSGAGVMQSMQWRCSLATVRQEGRINLRMHRGRAAWQAQDENLTGEQQQRTRSAVNSSPGNIPHVQGRVGPFHSPTARLRCHDAVIHSPQCLIAWQLGPHWQLDVCIDRDDKAHSNEQQQCGAHIVQHPWLAIARITPRTTTSRRRSFARLANTYNA